MGRKSYAAPGQPAAHRTSSPSVSFRIQILGSGSSGNAALLATPKTKLLLDAGFSCRELTRRLALIGEDVATLDGVLITHEHSDHIKGLLTLVKKHKIPVYITRRTDATLDWKQISAPREYFEAGQTVTAGDIELDTFTIPHDAVDPVMCIARHNGARIGFATDLGYAAQSVEHHLQGCQMLVLESNHDVDMLKVGPYPWSVKQRVAGRMGHLSNDAACKLLRQTVCSETQQVVLAHLSGHNNIPAVAEIAAKQALDACGRSNVSLHVASQSEPSEGFQF